MIGEGNLEFPERCEPLTSEEKLEGIKYMIYTSPPGEVNDVFNDCRAIFNNDKKLSAHAAEIFEKYNKDMFVVTRINSESKPFVLTEYNTLPDSTVIEPREGIICTFDHLKKKATKTNRYIQNEDLEPLRLEVQNQLDDYVATRYEGGVSSVFSHGNKIQLVIVNAAFQPNKFINMKWVSVWILDPEKNQVNGKIHIRIHHYEDGNVQCKILEQNSFEADPNCSSKKEYIAKIIKQIEASEDKLQTHFNSVFDRMNETKFKNLRRFLPLTKSKICWDSILSYKLSENLARVEQM